MQYMGALAMMDSAYDPLTGCVSYVLRCGEAHVPMSDFLGRRVRVRFLGDIVCVVCRKRIKKAYGQGFCYPCFRDNPLASPCIIFPEK